MPSIPIVVDSAFAENVSAGGNRCSLSFSPPLQLPRDVSPSIRLYSSSFNYSFPNIDTTNNQLHLRLMSIPAVTQTITLPTGLYTLTDLERTVKHAIHANATFGPFEIRFIAVNATQRVHIEVVNPTAHPFRMEFSQAASVGSLLGFTQDVDFTANTTSSHEGNAVANLDRNTSVLVQTSLCSGSVVNGRGGSSTVAAIHLAAAIPGTTYAYQPDNTLTVPASHLAGATITNASFALVNQSFEELNTLGESFQLVLEISW